MDRAFGVAEDAALVVDLQTRQGFAINPSKGANTNSFGVIEVRRSNEQDSPAKRPAPGSLR
jgi:hypothetical protein